MSEQEKETNNEREKKTEREGQQTQPQDHTDTAVFDTSRNYEMNILESLRNNKP